MMSCPTNHTQTLHLRTLHVLGFVIILLSLHRGLRLMVLLLHGNELSSTSLHFLVIGYDRSRGGGLGLLSAHHVLDVLDELRFVGAQFRLALNLYGTRARVVAHRVSMITRRTTGSFVVLSVRNRDAFNLLTRKSQ